jgi:uncharacterized membrane protein
LLGNYSSFANDVNDAGDVVGAACCGAGSGAFAIIGGIVTPLPGNASDASAISNGSPRHVVGYAGSPSLPVRWTINEGVASAPTHLTLGSATFGAALGVNDGSAAVGTAGANPAVWDAHGNLTSVSLPAGFIRGEGRDINNAGHSVLVLFTSGPTFSSARGYLRLASGVLVALPPLPGDVSSYANGISEVLNNAFFVAGSTRTSFEVSRAVRWTVNAATGEIMSTRVRAENSHALGVSDLGAVAGFLEPPSLRYSSFLWRDSDLLVLKAPKGGSSGRGWAISPSGQHIAGEAIFGGARHTVRWTILP